MLFAAACLGLFFIGFGFVGTIASADDQPTPLTAVFDVPVIEEVVPSGNKQLHVAWTKPTGIGPIDHYIVQWRTTAEGYHDYYDQANRSLQVEGQSATITDLLEPKDPHGQPIQYRVRVRAVGDSGPSAWSAEASGETITILSAPGDLSLERVGAGDQIQVSWNEPPLDAGPQPSEYIIQYKRKKYSGWKTHRLGRVDGSQTTFTTETLPVDATWKLRAAAVNAAGTGRWTSVKFIKLYSLPTAPGAINAIASDGQLTAEWALPADGSSIAGSRLRWRPAGNSQTSDWTTVEFDIPYKSAHTITGLVNGQAYELAVAVYNQSGSSDWTAPVTATPQAAPTAPTELGISQRRYNRLDVRWQWQDDNPYSLRSLTGFMIRWRHSAETEFQSENRAIVAADTRSHTFYKVPHSRSYIVEVTAFASDDTLYGSASASGLTNSPAVIIFDYFREEYEGNEPWIGHAIDARYFRVAANGRPGYWAYTRQWHNNWRMSRTVQLGFSHGVLNGAAYRSGQPVQTVLHELMHVWTYEWQAPEKPESLGIMWLYMNQQLNGRCNGGEILADALIYPVQLSEGIRYNSAYYRGCKAVGRQPSAEVTAMARSALDGEIPQWFYDNYQSDDGSIDMERLWYDLRDPDHDQYRYGPRGYSFRDMFGGFCSYKEAYRSYTSDRDAGTATANPWRDGGCLSHRPTVTAADAQSKPSTTSLPSSEIQLSWDKPLWIEEPVVNGYLVQWKTADENGYDDSRQALLEGLDETSFTVSGLVPNTEYTVRLAAVDMSDPGLLISRYGHERYIEITVTTPVS